MKKILYVTYRYPMPQTDGARIRIFNIGRILSKKYEVDMLSLNDGPITASDEEKKQIKNIFNTIYLHPFSKMKGNLNTIKFLFNKKPLQVNYFYFNKIRRFVLDNFEKYDAIFCSHTRTTEYGLYLPIKKYLDFIDSTSAHYSEAAKENVNFLWNKIYKLEHKRLELYEKRMTEEFDKEFITSPHDAEYLDNKPIVIPNGVKSELLERKNNHSEEDWIVFLGQMSYNPNVDAVKYFAKEVLPLLPKDIKFYIVGINPSKEVMSLKSVRVIVTGFVEDPYEYLEKAKIVVAPIRFSGGIQNKVLEAMALGKAVVTTSNCARSISNELVVGDNPKDMADRIKELLGDEEKRIKIGDRYKEIIKEHFTWDKIGEKLLKEVIV